MFNYSFGFPSLISLEDFAGLGRNKVWTGFIIWRFFFAQFKQYIV